MILETKQFPLHFSQDIGNIYGIGYYAASLSYKTRIQKSTHKLLSNLIYTLNAGILQRKKRKENFNILYPIRFETKEELNKPNFKLAFRLLYIFY